MRILLIMDPGIPIPPEFYGGIERIVYLLANEYIRQGHQVTLLAGPDSYCNGETVTFGVNDVNRSKIQRIKEMRFVWRYLREHKNGFDLIHNFGRLVYLLPVLNHPVKKIMSYQRRVTPRGIRIINGLPNKNIAFTACSNDCVQTGNVAGKWQAVYNTLDFSQYTLNETVNDEAPLMFLGRLDRIKGLHTAIQVANETGNTLLIGGNVAAEGEDHLYFKNEIEPQIDGKQIVYLGQLNDEQKNTWLGKAKAFLFPIEWDEPFGIVMIEAMACGTPVIGFGRGSVPEVVNARTGIVVNDVTGMKNAVDEMRKISRKGCREDAEERFALPVIAKQYLDLFTDAE